MNSESNWVNLLRLWGLYLMHNAYFIHKETKGNIYLYLYLYLFYMYTHEILAIGRDEYT